MTTSVKQHGPVWRVVEIDGTPAGGERAPSDGGGFADAKAAEHLSATINERRERSGRTYVPPEAAGEGKPVLKGKRA